jgi:hypothetical protein
MAVNRAVMPTKKLTQFSFDTRAAESFAEFELMGGQALSRQVSIGLEVSQPSLSQCE